MFSSSNCNNTFFTKKVLISYVYGFMTLMAVLGYGTTIDMFPREDLSDYYNTEISVQFEEQMLGFLTKKPCGRNVHY